MSNMTDLWLSCAIFQALNAPKLVFCRGSAPDPAGGAYDAPLNPLVGWGGAHPLPEGDTPSHSLEPFPSTPWASRGLSGPQHKFLIAPMHTGWAKKK